MSIQLPALYCQTVRNGGQVDFWPDNQRTAFVSKSFGGALSTRKRFLEAPDFYLRAEAFARSDGQQPAHWQDHGFPAGALGGKFILVATSRQVEMLSGGHGSKRDRRLETTSRRHRQRRRPSDGRQLEFPVIDNYSSNAGGSCRRPERIKVAEHALKWSFAPNPRI